MSKQNRITRLEQIKKGNECPAVLIIEEWRGEELPPGFQERCPQTMIIIDDIGPNSTEADKK